MKSCIINQMSSRKENLLFVKTLDGVLKMHFWCFCINSEGILFLICLSLNFSRDHDMEVLHTAVNFHIILMSSIWQTYVTVSKVKVTTNPNSRYLYWQEKQTCFHLKPSNFMCVYAPWPTLPTRPTYRS